MTSGATIEMICMASCGLIPARWLTALTAEFWLPPKT